MTTATSPSAAQEAQVPRAKAWRFWLVAGVLGAVCVVLVVAIVANLPLKDSIAHAQSSLRDAQRAADRIGDATGSYAGASAEALAPPAGLTLRDGDDPSTGPDVVSVHASDGVWAAAAQARPDACFYVRLEIGAEPRYGAGTACTGLAAREAQEDRW